MSEAIQNALIEVLGVLPDDFFQIHHVLPRDRYRHTPALLGQEYSDDMILLELTFITGRSKETRLARIRTLFYWENRRAVTLNLGPVEKVPVACSIFPREIYRAPRRWAEQTYKRLIYWNELERGGHFAALEQPEIFVNELRAAFDNPLFRERLA